MSITEPLLANQYYHIYNRGINSCNIFKNTHDYGKFLDLLSRYIVPIADILAYVMMPNHFHLLIRIKENIIYKYSNANRSNDAVGFEINKWKTVPQPEPVSVLAPDSVVKNTLNSFKKPSATKHLAHLFNAYTKAFNKRNERHGTLFERPFKRKLIDSEEYLKQIILYIHNNPVHHNFCNHPIEYGWSSYLAYISNRATKLKINDIIELFGDKANFEYCHTKPIDETSIEKYLEI